MTGGSDTARPAFRQRDFVILRHSQHEEPPEQMRKWSVQRQDNCLLMNELRELRQTTISLDHYTIPVIRLFHPPDHPDSAPAGVQSVWRPLATGRFFEHERR